METANKVKEIQLHILVTQNDDLGPLSSSTFCNLFREGEGKHLIFHFKLYLCTALLKIFFLYRRQSVVHVLRVVYTPLLNKNVGTVINIE